MPPRNLERKNEMKKAMLSLLLTACLLAAGCNAAAPGQDQPGAGLCGPAGRTRPGADGDASPDANAAADDEALASSQPTSGQLYGDACMPHFPGAGLHRGQPGPAGRGPGAADPPLSASGGQPVLRRPGRKLRPRHAATRRSAAHLYRQLRPRAPGGAAPIPGRHRHSGGSGGRNARL